MNRLVVSMLLGGVVALGTQGAVSQAQPTAPSKAPTPQSNQPLMAPAHQTADASSATAAGQTALVKQYCATCHNDRSKAGQLSLAAFDAARAADNAAIVEKMIRKLRAGMMPPAGAKRPESPALTNLAAALETRIDRAATLDPNPGSRPSPRLNRAEYASAVHELLGLDLDVNAYLPPDTLAHGFDNISEEQGISTAVMEGYLRAASAISRLAIGHIVA